MQKITLIPGDGIGPEVAGATVRVVEAAAGKFEWESFVVGAEAMEKSGDPLPDAVLESIRRNKVCLKGPVTTQIGKGFRSINVQLRQELELFANVRPAKTIPGLEGRFDNVDLVVIRENTEGLYSGLEHQVVPGVVESLKIITEKASMRVARFAFEYARAHGRQRVTAVHKANIMKLTDGLFLDCFRRMAENYPDIEADDRIIDNMCMQLVIRPETYDMLLMENLYGDIVSDLCSGLVGGLGVAPSANLGAEVGGLRGGARQCSRHRRSGRGQPPRLDAFLGPHVAPHGAQRGRRALGCGAASGGGRRPHLDSGLGRRGQYAPIH